MTEAGETATADVLTGAPIALAGRRATPPDVFAAQEGIGRIVLVPDQGLFVSGEPNPHLASQIARASNDWLAETWLTDKHPALYGAIVVANQSPLEAAREIRRVGSNPRFVAVVLGSNGGMHPFGNPMYDLLYEAAAECDLAVIIHAAGDVILDSPPNPTAAGAPATYGEVKALAAQPLTTHVVSMVAHGVFEKFSELRVLLVGGGVMWIPALVWRLDAVYKGLRREVPWLQKLPSEYINANVRVSTYPMSFIQDGPALQRLFESFDAFDDMLCFASGYAHEDWDRPRDVEAVVPERLRGRILSETAASLYRFPTATSGTSTPAPSTPRLRT